MSEEKLNLTNADISEFVTTTCEAFESYASNKQIRFSVIPLKQTLYIYLDRDKVHRILYNLLNNAFKFTPPEGRIDVFFKMENRRGIQYVCIIVQNTGQEIAADELPHIFDRYYQIGANTHRQATAGSGIGLHIVKEYVAMHQGFIEVESNKEEGTEFCVYLPTNLVDKRLLPREENIPDESLSLIHI